MPGRPPQGPMVDPWFIVVMVWALVACGALFFGVWLWPEYFPG